MRAKRLNGEGSPRQRKNGLWEVRYMLNGQRKSVYGKTAADALDKHKKAISGIERKKKLSKPTALTMSVLADEWLNYRAELVRIGSKSAHTWQANKNCVENQIKPRLGDVRVIDISRELLEKTYLIE